MKFDSSFDGRIFQVTEALDYGDAVSGQVIALDSLFKELGFESSIYSKWHDRRVADHRSDISALSATEKDVLIYHFYGYSEFTFDSCLAQYCTRILYYHNITPHAFFDRNSQLHAFCKKGREQLKSCLPQFHFFWAPSDYNLQELREAGAAAGACSVIPIIVSDVDSDAQLRAPGTAREQGAWLFVGRIAPNKGQIDLVDLFSVIRSENRTSARKLVLVGGYDASDRYFQELKARIASRDLEEVVTMTGKVLDAERDRHFRRSSVYVSVSKHEGFGVPLIEAAKRGLPVATLSTSAVGETLGNASGVATSEAELKGIIGRIIGDDAFRGKVLREQALNAARFSPAVVRRDLGQALRKVLPERRRFKGVSVIVCTYNRRGYLERLLDYLRFQSCRSFEVVVVDGPSIDGTKELLEGYSENIKIAHNPERNLGKSRNLGLEIASADIVAFVDDDAIPFDDWVETILLEYNRRPLTNAGLGGPAYYAGTLRFQVEDIGFNAKAEAIVNIDSERIGKEGWFRSSLGTNCTFKASVLKEVGGFDEQFDYFLDESEVCFRLQQRGWLVGYAKELFLRHEFAESANRKGKYAYNWYSICKNTAYFIGAYSGLKGDALRNYVHERARKERIAPLDAAVAAGEICVEEREKHVEAILSGLRQGLIDVASHPRTRRVVSGCRQFKGFALEGAGLRVGRDIRRLHVCILSKEFPPFSSSGGIGTLYYHLASELLLMGHEVSVILPAEQDRTLDQGRLHVIFAKRHQIVGGGVDSGFGNNMNWSLSALRALSEVDRHRGIDVIDTALWDAEALAVALVPTGERPPIVLRLVTPFKVVAEVNRWEVPEVVFSSFVGAERELISRVEAVVPISEAIAVEIERQYGIQRDFRWQTIPCGIAYWPSFDVNEGYAAFRELDGVPRAALDSERLIVFVGRLERRKGIDLLLEAAKTILAGNDEVQVVIAGRDVENWVERARSLVSDDEIRRIHFLGEVADATREKLFARAYCVVFPSRYESFGLVPLEAFVHGCPVIASRSGAIPEVVEDGVSGLLFEPDSSRSLGVCVKAILEDEALRQRLADGAKDCVRRLSSRNSALASIDVYASLAR